MFQITLEYLSSFQLCLHRKKKQNTQNKSQKQNKKEQTQTNKQNPKTTPPNPPPQNPKSFSLTMEIFDLGFITFLHPSTS